MTAVPTTRTWTASEVVTAANMNLYLRDVDNFLLARPICQARQATLQSIANTTWTSYTCDAEDVDSSGMHSTSSNTSRLTAVYPGWYLAFGGLSWAVNATGQRGTRFAVNGTASNGSGIFLSTTAATGAYYPDRGFLVYLNVSDYLEGQGWQNSGGNLNTAVTAEQMGTTAAIWTSN